jgi:signal transduction histidine kinase
VLRRNLDIVIAGGLGRRLHARGAHRVRLRRAPPAEPAARARILRHAPAASQVPAGPARAGLVLIELANLARPAVPTSSPRPGRSSSDSSSRIYSAGRYSTGRALLGCALLVVAAIPLAGIEPGDPVAFTDIAFFVMFLGGPFVGGRIVRSRVARERVLEVERDTRAAEAVAEERTRIARELHDVVVARDQRGRPAGARRPQAAVRGARRRTRGRSTSSSGSASRR